jgi:hypothetical protein
MSPTTRTKPLTKRPAWTALASHHYKPQKLHLRNLFADDPTRGERLTVDAAALFLDYSKNRVTDRTQNLLIPLADDSGLSAGYTSGSPGALLVLGLLLSPIIAGATMSLSSVSVIGNALRLRKATL